MAALSHDADRVCKAGLYVGAASAEGGVGRASMLASSAGSSSGVMGRYSTEYAYVCFELVVDLAEDPEPRFEELECPDVIVGEFPPGSAITLEAVT